MKPIFYKRYVDDVIAVFESQSDVDAFYNFSKARHENIKFTFAKKKNNKLPFLDILINNNESDLQTSVIHKKTYKSLLNYFNFVTNCYKLGLIKTLMNRMYRINNSWTGFDKGLKDLKNIIQKNLHPLKRIGPVVKSYLNDQINCWNEKTSQNTEPEIKVRYLSYRLLDYIPKSGKRKLNNFVKDFCKSLKVKLVFTSKKLRCGFFNKRSISK